MVFKYQNIRVKDFKKFSYDKLMEHTSKTIENSIFNYAVFTMAPLFTEYRDMLKKLPDISYYLSATIRVKISMKTLIDHLRFVQEGQTIRIEYGVGNVLYGDKKIPIQELMDIIEFGSGSHKYPASGIYKKIRLKYVDLFTQVLNDSFNASFDSVVNYSLSNFGKRGDFVKVSNK